MRKKLIDAKNEYFDLMKNHREELSLNDVADIIKESRGAIADAIVFAFAAGYALGRKNK